MSNDLIGELRSWQGSDADAHRPGPNPTHCAVCSLRFPCDWRMAIDEMSQAANKIEKLQTALLAVALRAALLTVAEYDWMPHERDETLGNISQCVDDCVRCLIDSFSSS